MSNEKLENLIENFNLYLNKTKVEETARAMKEEYFHYHYCIYFPRFLFLF